MQSAHTKRGSPEPDPELWSINSSKVPLSLR